MNTGSGMSHVTAMVPRAPVNQCRRDSGADTTTFCLLEPLVYSDVCFVCSPRPTPYKGLSAHPRLWPLRTCLQQQSPDFHSTETSHGNPHRLQLTILFLLHPLRPPFLLSLRSRVSSPFGSVIYAHVFR